MATTYPTTGTSNFNLDLNDVVEEAFERCGKEMRSGYDLRTAQRSLNVMFMEWANRGINMWTIDTGSIPLTYNVGTYALPLDTVDLLDHVVRTGTGVTQTDINISRISEATYLMIPNKNATGRPIQVWVQRLSGALSPTGSVASPQITVWPLPDPSNTYTFVYTRLRRIQDAGTGINGQDMPFRFVPAMVAGLAYYLAVKLPDVDPQRVLGLKAVYDEQFQLAADEDREKAPIRLVPRVNFYR